MTAGELLERYRNFESDIGLMRDEREARREKRDADELRSRWRNLALLAVGWIAAAILVALVLGQPR